MEAGRDEAGKVPLEFGIHSDGRQRNADRTSIVERLLGCKNMIPQIMRLNLIIFDYDPARIRRVRTASISRTIIFVRYF